MKETIVLGRLDTSNECTVTVRITMKQTVVTTIGVRVARIVKVTEAVVTAITVTVAKQKLELGLWLKV